MSAPRRSNFLTDLIDADLAAGRVVKVVTRFPPEPNGYLHIGHAKSICLNFGLSRDYRGDCHLRLDDTNPVTEDVDYVDSIQHDVHWLGFEWSGPTRFASDYFETMYACAEQLIRDGKAYIDDQNVEEIRAGRGDFTRPGVASPRRDRPAAESMELFRQMRAGKFADGTLVLRARIDMAHPNVIMRDPLLYRIRHAHHHRTENQWCIYPMYDYAHPLEDAVEGITHSICTLEFESNRELYDWVLDNTLNPQTNAQWSPRPHQYEFARLALGFTLMSKRKLLQLVQEGLVSGWDDPRMPTIAGLRRRGVTPEALREFADLIGVAKNNSFVDVAKLEYCIRQDLEQRAPRALAVLKPLKVELTNWPADKVESLELPWWPGEPERGGTRNVPISRQLLIEQEDFAEVPPADWKRLAPGWTVRLYGAGLLRCDAVVRDSSGEIALLKCSYDATTAPAAGTIHWVSATHGVPSPVRLYDRLFRSEQPEAQGDFREQLNPDSLVLCPDAVLEPALLQAAPGSHFQFVRLGYFLADPVDSKPGAAAFHRTIGLRDTWAKAGRAAHDGRPQRDRQPAKVQAKPAAPKKSRAEWRAEARAAQPELALCYQRILDAGVDLESADLLTADLPTAHFFLLAAAHALPPSVARWLLNDLLGALGDKPITELPIDGTTFGRFVALVDAGSVTGAAAKTLLAHLCQHGGDPAQLLETLGLARVEDAGALQTAVGEVLASLPAETARYRAGETKLFGVLLGAAMKKLRGAADAAAVRQALIDKLG